jgi:hypothetical protein
MTTTNIPYAQAKLCDYRGQREYLSENTSGFCDHCTSDITGYLIRVNTDNDSFTYCNQCGCDTNAFCRDCDTTEDITQ